MAAICWAIDQSIGHGEAKNDLRSLIGLCEQLGFGEDQIRRTIDEGMEAYKKDRGRSLLAEAFPEMGAEGPPPAG